MPREFRAAVPVAVDIESIARAAATVDDTLAVRAMAHGQVIQLVDSSDQTILSIQATRLLDLPADVARVAPELRAPATSSTAPVYWLEAFAPWTPGGEVGARIVVELTRALNGELSRSDS